MVFALYEAFKARRISLEFAESAYIAGAISSILLVCFIGIPVMIIASDDPRARFFVLASIDFVICTSLLLFIFVPKENFRRKGGSLKNSIKSSMQMKTSQASGVTGVSRMSSTASDASDDDEGLRVLNNPKTVKELEEKVAALKNEISVLKKEGNNPQKDVNKGDYDAVATKEDDIA